MNLENWTLKEIKDCCASFLRTKKDGSKILLCNQCLIHPLCFKTFTALPYSWDLKEKYNFSDKEMELISFFKNYGLSKIEKVASEEVFLKDESGKIWISISEKNTGFFNNLPVGDYDISELLESEE